MNVRETPFQPVLPDPYFLSDGELLKVLPIALGIGRIEISCANTRPVGRAVVSVNGQDTSNRINSVIEHEIGKRVLSLDTFGSRRGKLLLRGLNLSVQDPRVPCRKVAR